MNPKKKTIPCERCGAKAELHVVPDDREDAPAKFTITRECSGVCPTTYLPVTPEQMRDLTGLELTGWAPKS